MGGTFAAFARLHVPGDPLILFNAWDAGSAAAVERAGAKAIATGSQSVAKANGFDDGEQLPLELALANAARVIAAVDLPVSIDFEGGYAGGEAALAENIALLAATGAIGCNFEDQMVGGDGLWPRRAQCGRIDAMRRGAGDGLFINARTDVFLKAKPADHDAALADAAIERCLAYSDSGANGFFIPGLADLKLVERIVRASPVPVNAMAFPGAPSKAQWATAGIARISHGPFPHRGAMNWLEDAVRAELAA